MARAHFDTGGEGGVPLKRRGRRYLRSLAPAVDPADLEDTLSGRLPDGWARLRHVDTDGRPMTVVAGLRGVFVLEPVGGDPDHSATTVIGKCVALGAELGVTVSPLLVTRRGEVGSIEGVTTVPIDDLHGFLIRHRGPGRLSWDRFREIRERLAVG